MTALVSSQALLAATQRNMSKARFGDIRINSHAAIAGSQRPSADLCDKLRRLANRRFILRAAKG
ncbi:MAG: hypothetical protein JNL25_13675 [Rhodospirillaceae bacterium]|nr:hypothetical protein [Rhodospirillaceae bacterium]